MILKFLKDSLSISACSETVTWIVGKKILKGIKKTEKTNNNKKTNKFFQQEIFVCSES